MLVEDAAVLTADGCIFRYADSGLIVGESATAVCTECTSQRNANDGYCVNANAAVTLRDCDGSYNGDEGASPHSASILHIVVGRYHHNGHAGVLAVQTSQRAYSPPGQPRKEQRTQRSHFQTRSKPSDVLSMSQRSRQVWNRCSGSTPGASGGMEAFGSALRACRKGFSSRYVLY